MYAAAAHESRPEPARSKLRGDLRPCAVDNEDLVARSVVPEREADRLGRHGATELHDDAGHVVYSAFSFT